MLFVRVQPLIRAVGSVFVSHTTPADLPLATRHDRPPADLPPPASVRRTCGRASRRSPSFCRHRSAQRKWTRRLRPRRELVSAVGTRFVFRIFRKKQLGWIRVDLVVDLYVLWPSKSQDPPTEEMFFFSNGGGYGFQYKDKYRSNAWLFHDHPASV